MVSFGVPLLILLLPLFSVPSADAGKTQKKRRQQQQHQQQQPTTIPRLRKRTSDAQPMLPITDDWTTRTYEDWSACSPEVLSLVAMENNIILPPRADRALILYNYFQNTAAPRTTSILQPPIATTSATIPTIRIPLSIVNTQPRPRPAALQQSSSNRFQLLAGPATTTASSTIVTSCGPSSPPTLLSLIHLGPSSPASLPPTVFDHHVYSPPRVPPTLQPHNHLQSPVPRPTFNTRPSIMPRQGIATAPPTVSSQSPAAQDATDRMIAAVQQSFADQNFAILQQISAMNQRLSDLQQSHDDIIASAQAAIPTCTATTSPPLSIFQPPTADHQSFNLQPATYSCPPSAYYQTQPPATVQQATYYQLPQVATYTPASVPVTTHVTYTTYDASATSSAPPQLPTPSPAIPPHYMGQPMSDAQFRTPAMKDTTLKKIRAGEYVDLTEFIYRNRRDTHEGFSMVLGTDKLSGDQSVDVIPRAFKADFLNLTSGCMLS